MDFYESSYSSMLTECCEPSREDPAKFLWHLIKHRLDLTKIYPATTPAPPGRRRVTSQQPQGPVAMDALLKLLGSLNTFGKSEVFRLLLEARYLVPFIIPGSNGYHDESTALKYIETLVSNEGEKLNLMTDTSIRRVAVISECSTAASATAGWIESVFHVQSLHSLDYSKRKNVTKQPCIAELGWGFLKQDSKYSPVIVLHVIGNYSPILSYVQEFADALVIDCGEKVRQTVISHPYIINWIKSEDEEDDVINHDIPQFEVTLRCERSDAHNSITYHLLDCLESKNRSAIASIDVNCVSKSNTLTMNAKELCQRIDFSDMRTQVLQLQQLFVKQAQLEIQNQQSKEFADFDREIQDIKHRMLSLAPDSENIALVVYFINILELESSAEREMAILDLKYHLDIACRELSESACERYRDARDVYSNSSGPVQQEAYKNALHEWDLSITGIEHLWRELSHMYASNPNRYQKFPTLAAQHLLDGFPIELMDGDAAMVNINWIRAILYRLSDSDMLPTARVFVLSIMGIQSCGKSTLLNIMFGVQLPTSVSKTTRGVNMQLLKCDGRTEYDYILLLDTEGIRSPEHLGLEDSVWRDNRMATLAILPADATIVLTKGEDTITISEILPIVLSAFLDSVLAESISGQMASKFYFVFNQINLTQKKKMEQMVHTFHQELRRSAKAIEVVRGQVKLSESEIKELETAGNLSDTYFNDLAIDINDDKASDVRFLGAISGSNEPPKDTPLCTYGERLLEFREYIHQRAIRNELNPWKGRLFDEFMNYLDLVWSCIKRSDFQLNFKAAHKRLVYEMVSQKMTEFKKKLATIYSKHIADIEQTIQLDKSNNVNGQSQDYTTKLETLVKADLDILDNEVQTFLNIEMVIMWQDNELCKWEALREKRKKFSCNLIEKTFKQVFINAAIVSRYKILLQDKLHGEFLHGKPYCDDTFNDFFSTIVCQLDKAHPMSYRDVPQRILKALTQVATTAEIKIMSYRLESNDMMYRESRDKSRNYSYVIPCKESSRQFTLDSIDTLVSNYVYQGLSHVDCYTDDVAVECLNDTKSMMIQEKIPNTHRDYAVSIAFCRMISILGEKQRKWDQTHGVLAKFQECKESMRYYTRTLTLGGQPEVIFIALLDKWLEENLAGAIVEEIENYVVGSLKNQRWVSSPESMQALIDNEIVHDVENGLIDKVLQDIQNPIDHTTTTLKGVIKKEIQASYPTVKESVVSIVKSAISIAAEAASCIDCNRSKCFLTTLKRELQTNLKKRLPSVLVVNIPNPDNHAMNFDIHGPTIFTTNKELNITLFALEKLKHHSENLISLDFEKDDHVDSILSIMRSESFGAEDGIKPRCGVPCPRCRCPCTKSHGHANENDRLHDTYHQPLGIVGGHWVQTNELTEMSCPLCVENGCSMVFSTGNRPYREFHLVYPGWALPTIQRPLPLREYIFAHYQDQIVNKYNKITSSLIPADYLRHDLTTIKREISNLLSQRGSN